MRTANNNFTVEALVAKYRNYVKEHCSKLRPFYGDLGAVTMISNSPERNADEQLLVTLYKNVAGNNADENVLSALFKYSQKYMEAGLEQGEFAFLCEHFNEVVAYEFSNRETWGESRRRNNVPSKTYDIIRNMVKPQNGQTIFIADTADGDIAALFPNCTIKGFTGHTLDEDAWALGQIRLYAAGINSEIVDGSDDKDCPLPEEGSVDVVIYGTQWRTACKSLKHLYRLLKKDGKMFIFTGRKKLVGKENEFTLRQRLVKDKSIHTIVSFEDNFSKIPVERMLLYIEKVENKEVNLVNMKKQTSKVISSDLLDPEILWPNYYDAIRPKNGVPLSKIVTLPEEKELCNFVNGQFALPDTAKNMFLVLPYNLGDTYMDANLWHKQVAMVDDPCFKEEDWVWFYTTNKPCVLITGNTKELRVGYTTGVPGNGFAYMESCCLVPRNGIDVRYVAALLFEPSVREQILAICDGHIWFGTLSLVLDKIIIPNHNEKERLNYLVEANYEALISSQEKLKQEAEHYRKAVRMRKHSLTQSVSSVEAMFYALNAYRERQNGTISDNEVISRVKGTTVREAFDFISRSLNNMMPALEHIADVEYSFGKPEWIDPEEFMENYIAKKENGWLNFKPIITWEEGNNKAKSDIFNDEKELVIAGGEPLNKFMFPKDALERVFENIVANANAHGFTDESRKDYQLKFSWHTDGLSLLIEIENNGTPIPEDYDTVSLLEYGVSSALHQNGHNGIGCNEIDDIMKRYDGKVEIISSPQNDYTVKYVLTFNHTNTVSIM